MTRTRLHSISIVAAIALAAVVAAPSHAEQIAVGNFEIGRAHV